MDRRRLLGGLAGLALAVGLLLACFTPGGLFNSGVVTETVDTPFGSVSRSVGGRGSPWPVVGYVLSGLGTVGLVVAFALKSPRE